MVETVYKQMKWRSALGCGAIYDEEEEEEE
jgi:hypothetical protein